MTSDVAARALFDARDGVASWHLQERPIDGHHDGVVIPNARSPRLECKYLLTYSSDSGCLADMRMKGRDEALQGVGRQSAS